MSILVSKRQSDGYIAALTGHLSNDGKRPLCNMNPRDGHEFVEHGDGCNYVCAGCLDKTKLLPIKIVKEL